MKTRQRVIPAVKQKVVEETVISLLIDHYHKSVDLNLGQTDETGVVHNHRSVHIPKTGYDMLMSEKPDWAAKKPAGEFRTEDIFTVMDLLGID